MGEFAAEEFRANASKLHKRVWRLVKSTFPDWKWVQEKYISVDGNTLSIDISSKIPIKIAIELHGKQHLEYVQHFHGNKWGFKRAVARDVAKKKYLIENDYSFVEFYTTEKLSDSDIINRILDKIRGE